MLDYLDYGQVTAIGVSWGGALAQQFAHDYPERCKKLILAATAAGAVIRELFRFSSIHHQVARLDMFGDDLSRVNFFSRIHKKPATILQFVN